MQYKIINGAVFYDGEMVLENIDFEINDKEKIAVVGRNGCGKSTLLKAILGEIELDEGTGESEFQVIRAGNPEIGYLRQIPFEDESISMIDEVRKVFSHLIEMEKRLEYLVTNMENGNEKLVSEYSDLNEKYILLGGMTYKKEYQAMIRSFGFTAEDEVKPVSAFSGGQRTKIAFMKLLLSKPDILLLDEPTNHLDIETIEWLETYLRNYKSALVLVSHDRMFLDRVVGKVYEIEYGETKCYNGNYTAFERLKNEYHIKQQRDHDMQQAEIQRITRLIERFRYKATKAKMVQSKIRLLEHMKIINAPDRYDSRTYRADLQPRISSSRQVLSVSQLVIGYDRPLAEINLNLERGQKLGIIGGNGIGKSTFLKTLMGDVPKISGTYTFGFNTEVGYFDQQLAQINGSITLFDAFSSAYPALNDTEVRTALGAFQFTGDDVFRPASTLSGGEKVRLALCKLMHRKPNVLLLDEPTNHMDIVGKETLEKILSAYEGTVIFVSHDRYFVSKIADRLLVFNDNGTKLYPMTFEEYEQKIQGEQTDILPSEKNVKDEKKTAKRYMSPLKEKGKLQRRIDKLEQLLEQSSNELLELHNQLELPENCTDYLKITELQNAIENVKEKESELMDEWSQLMEQMDSLEV